jgi:hypothetical protein
VEIHPRFDLWMRGARFGTVIRMDKPSTVFPQGVAVVTMDHSQVKGVRRFVVADLKVIATASCPPDCDDFCCEPTNSCGSPWAGNGDGEGEV